jgi:hypothetical protein
MRVKKIFQIPVDLTPEYLHLAPGFGTLSGTLKPVL